MLSRSLWIAACLLGVLGTVLFQHVGKVEDDSLTIGIIQTATHPALDQVRDSFIAELQRRTEGRVHFVVQNAEGSAAQAQNIVSSFHSHKRIGAILAIGTPAVQAAARVEKDKPIFIAAVSDPESLGVIHPGTNVSGTTDRVDTDAQAALILQLVPSVKTVAIVYNPGENNSQVMVERMKRSLLERGLTPVLVGVHVESEIAQAIASASHKADVILVPADNLIVGAMPLVSKEALAKGRPLIASDIPSVSKGALMAEGADYSDLGRDTAGMAYRVLMKGEKPEDVGISHPSGSKILLNKRAMEALHIAIPMDLISRVQVVEGGDDAS